MSLSPKTLTLFAQVREVVPTDIPVPNLRAAGVCAGDEIDRSASTRVSVTFRAYADAR